MPGALAFIVYGCAAIACALSALAVARRGAIDRSDRPVAVAALALMALWCALVAALGSDHAFVRGAGIARNLGLIFLLFRLFANDGRDESVRLVRPVIAALAFVELLQAPLLALAAGEGAVFALQTSAVLRVLVAVGALFLVHNLFAGAAESSRRLLAWNCAALALFWGFELNYFTVAWLAGPGSAELAVLRGLVALAVGPIFAAGFVVATSGLAFRPSRAVTFSTLSLVIIGAYLAVMLGLAEWVGRFSGDLARIAQVGFVLAAIGLALLWLPSGRLRGWLRVAVLKHLFKHRYDYRGEWIRFTSTIGRAADAGRGLHERAIQSLADITGSGAGLLLLPDEDGDLALAERWRWPDAQVPPRAMPRELARIMEQRALIVDFDEARRGIEHHGEAGFVPGWLRGEDRAWAGVPLLHQDRLVGVVVLARPQIDRRLDWEDFDLLAVAGQQVASYLAEQAGQEALEEASRFEEFNRRMAFIMHDIKNLSSQMSLLLRNAEKHADNPEFRKDMLVTLRNSSDKLNALLARLGRYRAPSIEQHAPFDLTVLARELRERFAGQHEVKVSENGPCRVKGDREVLEQALVHLVQNAVEASPPGAAVLLEVHNDGLRGAVAVVDSGCGMSAQFVRNELFRPFVSSKNGGFGIGACEAREMIRAMGGRLDVESREGLGSRFAVSLPSAEAARLIAERRTLRNPIESETA